MTSILMFRAMSLMSAALNCTAACGHSTGGGDGACTVALTGAQTGSSKCSNVLAIFARDSNFSAVNFSNTGGSPVVNISIRFPGEPATKTYRSADAGEVASVMVNLNNTSVWAAVVDPSSRKPVVGSFTLTISSMSTLSSAGRGKVLQVHGSLTATLPSMPSTAATGTVTLHATF